MPKPYELQGRVPLNVIPNDWLQRSDDFEARLMRAGLNGVPVIEAPANSSTGLDDSVALGEMLTRLAGAQELGEYLVQLKAEQPNSPLMRAMCCNCACPVVPYPEEMLALFTVLLTRSVNADGQRRVPLDVLQQLGESGMRVLPLLRKHLHTAPLQADDPRIDKMTAAIDSLVAYPLRSGLLKALKPVAVTPAVTSTPPSLAALKTLGVRPSSAVLVAGKQPGFSQAMASLSYGGAHVTKLLREALAQGPDDALGKLLRASSPNGALPQSAAGLNAALLRLLWSYRDPSNLGAMRWDKFVQDTQGQGQQVLDAMQQAQQLGVPARPNYRFLAATVEELRCSMPANEAKQLCYELLRKDGLLPTSVPALDAVSKSTNRHALSGKGLCAVQHLFPTLVPLVEACIDKGMDPKDMHILGTPYASNPLVAAYLRVLGVDVTEAKDHGGNTRAFEENRVQEIGTFLHRIVHRDTQPTNGWKILDDGGLLQCTIAGYDSSAAVGLSQEDLAKTFPVERCEAIEQTTRGLTELAKQPLRYRTIPVASCYGKKQEGDLIGWSLADSLIHELRQAGKIESTQHITVVSAGTVGLATARHLSDAGFAVTLVDKDPAKCKHAQAAGFAAATTLGDVLPQTQVVFSCTGKTALDGQTLQDWTGTIASGSSAAIEYNRAQINALRRQPIDELNRGRPLNFSGDGYENLSPEQIGITRALLFVALTQDVRGQAVDLIPVDSKRDSQAVKAWRQSGGHKTPKLQRNATTKSQTKRPDSVGGGARHDEWMAYLSSLERAVCPPPSQVGFVPGVYFFTDDDNSVRFVDTRGHTEEVTASLPSGLNAVPCRVHPVNEVTPTECVLEFTSSGGSSARGFQATATEAVVGTEHAIDRLVNIAQDIDSRRHPSWGTRLTRALLFESENKLLFSFHGSTHLHSIDKKLSGDCLYARMAEQNLVEVQRQPPRVLVRGLNGDNVIERAFAHYGVPAAFTHIDALVPMDDSGQFVLVGRTQDGLLAIAPLRQGPEGQKVTVLPEGAVFRGMHRPDAITHPFEYAIDYTLPEDPVELESMRQLRVSFGWSSRIVN